MAGDSKKRFAFPNLVRAFHDGERFGDGVMKVVDAGELVLPTGKIIACDPGYLIVSQLHEQPFTRSVPPGRYPVQIALLRQRGWKKNPNFERVACGKITFQDAPVKKWEMAVQPRWDASKLKPGYILGYGVDGGEGCFLDERTQSRLPKDQTAYFEAFTKAMRFQSEAFLSLQSNPADTDRQAKAKEAWIQMMDAYRLIEPPGLGAMFASRFMPETICDRFSTAVIDEQTGANLVRFQSGEGDGCYASYFGLAADGSPACLVTDFGLLIRSVIATLKIPVPQVKKGKLTHPRLSHAGIKSIQFEYKPQPAEITFAFKEALYVQDVRLINRPKEKARLSASGGQTTWYFRLDEPLAKTARLEVDYTLKTVAL